MTGTSHVRINKKHDASQLLTSLKINIELLRRIPAFRTPEVEKVLLDCIPIAEEILTWAPQYDFRTETETYTSNGYWTIIIVANKLCEYVMQHPYLSLYVQDVLQLLITGFPLLKATHEYSSSGAKSRVLHSESTPVLIDLMHLYLNSPKIIEALCGPACGPHLCASERLTRDAYQTVVSMYSSPNWVDAFKCLTSRKFRGKRMAEFAKKFDVQFTQKVLSISDFEPVRTWLPIFSTFFKKLEAKNIFVDRRSRYQLVFNAAGQPELSVSNSVDNIRPKIRCKYLCYGRSGGENNNNNALVFALHGGGFAAQSPETHEFYTRHWAPKIPGVPILSVDYSHAPKYKFPYALQEILDMYLWLTNPKSIKEVVQQIGFFPERIVLFGDSAGGNQAMSLLLVLNDIKRLFSHNIEYENFLMPSGIVTCYAAFNIIPKFAPSYFMTAIDPFLSPMVLFNLIDAYVPTANLVCQNKTDEVYEWSSSNYTKSNSWFSYAKDTVKWLYPFSTDSSLPNAWFACDKEELIGRLNKFNNLFEHPYLSSIKYAHFDSLKETELYLITPYFDPLHDDSIEMAKTWQGPLTIDILDALSHGFLHFIQFSHEAAEGCDLALRRVKKALRL